jgi:hypothetical protein
MAQSASECHGTSSSSLPGQPPLKYRVTFVNQGARVRIETNAPGVLQLAQRVLPIGSQVEHADAADTTFSLRTASGVATDPVPHRLFRDGDPVDASTDLDVLIKRLESDLHFAVASHARASLFVHAGVVGWHGGAILLPGPSMSGKSSLVAALLRGGAEYYSDEYAVVDGKGQVHPYARPLLLRDAENGRGPAGVQRPDPSVGATPLPAHLIVSTYHSPGQRFEPSIRDSSHGLMVLIANTVRVRECPRFALDHLAPIAGTATTLEGVRGDADEAAGWLLRYEGRRS